MSFFRRAIKRIARGVVRIGVREAVRSLAAAQKSINARQMQILAGQFLDAVQDIPADQVIGFVDVSPNDRRAVTPASLAKVLDIVFTGGLPLVIVENGRQQFLPTHVLKALRTAAKARARLDSVAPPLARGYLIEGVSVRTAQSPLHPTGTLRP